MNWEEKIRDLKQKEEESKTESLRRIEEEQKLCVEVLKQLRCEEKLTQIRDEKWQVGKVSMQMGNDVDYYNYRDYHHGRRTPFYEVLKDLKWPGRAKISLFVVWAHFDPGGYKGDPADEGSGWENPHITPIRKYLSIEAVFRTPGKLALSIMPDYYNGPGFLEYNPENWAILIPENPQPEKQLEEYLVKDCINRQSFERSDSCYEAPPYVPLKAEGDTRAVKALIQNPDIHIVDFFNEGFEGLEYLLELAKKARLEKK